MCLLGAGTDDFCAPMKQAAILVIVTAALAAPASALGAPQLAAPIPTARAAQMAGALTVPASPLNIASGRIALNAYAAYLNALVKQAPIGVANDTTFIAMISGPEGCKSALAGLTQPGTQISSEVQHTLNTLGREMGDDLAIGFDQASLPAFTKFSSVLSHLHWTRASGAAQIVKRYVRTQTAVLGLTQSELCQNVLYAAAAPDKPPLGTRSFNRSYNQASQAADNALANLMRLMQSVETWGERGLVTRIANLATEVSELTKSDLLQSGTTLTSALETT